MTRPKKSNVQLVSLFLTDLVFKKLTIKLRKTNIPVAAITLDASIEEIQENTFVTNFEISVHKEDDPGADFTSTLRYQIVSRSIVPNSRKEIEGFARFGGPYNALTHARETIGVLTSKAFGRAALLPLLDIVRFGRSVTLKSMKTIDAPHQEGGNERQEPEKPK